MNETVRFLWPFVCLQIFIVNIMAQNPDDISMVIQMMIPYKTVYGFPKKCSKITEYQTITEAELRENYRTCQMEALKRWRITFYSYVSGTKKKFCKSLNDIY